MKLSSRDRAKVNAALMLLQDAGQDIGEVTRLAQAGLDMGTPAKLSYERAFNRFVERVPAFRAPLQRLGQLMDASDDRTIAGYNHAMTRYAETGDSAALQAILPTMQADMATMAEHTGDAGFAEGLGDTVPAVPAENSNAPVVSPTPARPGHGPMGYSPAAARANGAASPVTPE